MKLYEVTMTDGKGEIVCEVEAWTAKQAKEVAWAEWGRPDLKITGVKDTLFRTA